MVCSENGLVKVSEQRLLEQISAPWRKCWMTEKKNGRREKKGSEKRNQVADKTNNNIRHAAQTK